MKPFLTILTAVIAVGLVSTLFGPSASADVEGYVVVTEEAMGATVAANSSTLVIAECPSGKDAIGGGWINVDHTQIIITEDRVFEDTDNDWAVRFRNTTGTAADLGDVYAICAVTS